ncbi:hypothetical protein AB1N83_002947 [Pleurotus pulmonarius]
MTRGNQREQDRLRAAKKAPAKKPKESATNLAKRKEADAEALRAKQKEKGRGKSRCWILRQITAIPVEGISFFHAGPPYFL